MINIGYCIQVGMHTGPGGNRGDAKPSRAGKPGRLYDDELSCLTWERKYLMPYYIYALMPGEASRARDLVIINEFKDFKDAKNAVRTLRAEEPLEDGHIYKIIFADDQAEAEQRLCEFREEPIVKEWEK